MNNYITIFNNFIDTNRGAGAQSVTVNQLVVSSIPERIEYLFKIYIFISSLWCRGKFENSAESGERSVLTLDFLCLPCCVRDTA